MPIPDLFLFGVPCAVMAVAVYNFAEHCRDVRRKRAAAADARVAGLAALVDAEAIAFSGSVAAQAAIDDTLTAAYDRYADLYDTPKELTP